METPMQTAIPLRGRLIAATLLHPAPRRSPLSVDRRLSMSFSLLADGRLPFDRPALAGIPFVIQLAAPTVTMVEVFLLMRIVYCGLTRRRVIPDIAARAPGCACAAREALSAVLAYAAAGQAGGWIVGPALGYRPFSFHIAGTLFGCATPPPIGEILTWALYNFVLFAALPMLWFLRRYDPARLNLRSTNPGNDWLVVVVVCLVESAFEFTVLDNGVWRLGLRQILIGAPLELPPLFHRHRGAADHGADLCDPDPALSQIDRIGDHLTVLLGGLTYALMHVIVEGWSAFDSPRDAALSLIFVVLGYLGPGMIKTFITLRTGNAWVHALGYHAIAPHVIIDTPLIVQAFSVR